MESFINFTFEKIKPSFYVWLGDSPPHDVWKQTSKGHLDGINYITDRLKKEGYNKQGTFYPILGNHEGLPCDGYNLDGDSHTWILNQTYKMWETWFDKSGISMYIS